MALSASKRWPVALAMVFTAYVAVTMLYVHRVGGPPEVAPPNQIFLVGFADISQFFLMLGPGLLAIKKSLRSEGRARVFWGLMAAGFATWATAQAGWIIEEVLLRKQIPDPFWADVVLFFHFVPFTAALIVRPHLPGQLRRIVLSAIDWTMVLLWWLYLYVFLVFPSQFIRADRSGYDSSYNTLYLSENLVWLGLLAFFFLTTADEWKTIYGHLLGAGALYTVSSRLIDVAISNGDYYSGSVYDVPLVAATLWFVWAIASAPEQQAIGELPDYDEEQAWVPRVALLALLSIPVMASWIERSSRPHDSIFHFRFIVSMVAIVVLGTLVFLKQYLLDRERIRLLAESRQNYVNLQRIQAQLVQSEKLASIGQLVSGAAHEINNPLTAILGYSELMESDPSADDTVRAHAAKIKIQALRTKNLVGNLLKFARQGNTERKLISLNGVVESALRLREMDQSGKSIAFVRELEPELPLTWGDAVQLTDVCLQLLGNAADVVTDQGGKIVVRTYSVNGFVTVEVSDNGPGMSDPNRVFDPFYTTKSPGKGTGLGLSVCYGIIADHKGEIIAENLPQGGARFRVRLPVHQPSLPPSSQLSPQISPKLSRRSASAPL
jgi:signal transduction histidine kinase